MVDHSVEQMQALIKDLLDHSKVGADATPFQAVDLAGVVQTVLAELEEKMGDQQGGVHCGRLPEVTGDRIQLRRLFQNLLTNAVNYRSERPLQIFLDSQEDEGHWEFRIRDNGIGIDAQHHDKIFEIFHRLHSEDEFPGTGIGLATCRKIVELHGGKIWVDSVPGEGSCFCFTIPKNTGTRPADGFESPVY